MQHCFKDWPEPQKLVQLMVPGLEERARMFSPLSTLSQLSPGETPPMPGCGSSSSVLPPGARCCPRGPQAGDCAGYFDAPGAAAAPLKLFQAVPTTLPGVTLVFCCIEHLKDMKASLLLLLWIRQCAPKCLSPNSVLCPRDKRKRWYQTFHCVGPTLKLFTLVQEKDSDAANTALQIYLACIRKLLRSFDGYECQEADGSFMLAFKDPIDAVLFCLTVRMLVLAVLV